LKYRLNQPVSRRRKDAQGTRHRRYAVADRELQRPPRFAIQINSRARVTRDYAYFVENRLRERYRLEGVPVIIDFVERNERRARGRRAAA